MRDHKIRTKQTGGLHFKLSVGDEVFVDYNGELLTVVYQGQDDGKCCLSFVGPRSFVLGRWHKKQGGNYDY